jgi:hypothetical protein
MTEYFHHFIRQFFQATPATPRRIRWRLWSEGGAEVRKELDFVSKEVCMRLYLHICCIELWRIDYQHRGLSERY